MLPFLAQNKFADVKAFALLIFVLIHTLHGADINVIAGKVTEVNDNGAWSWFMDERAIIDDGKLLIGSVRANGRFEQNQLPGWGNVELSALDLRSGKKDIIKIHERFEQDDHDNPGLIRLPDGHFLAMYSKHGREQSFIIGSRRRQVIHIHGGRCRNLRRRGRKGIFAGTW